MACARWAYILKYSNTKSREPDNIRVDELGLCCLNVIKDVTVAHCDFNSLCLCINLLVSKVPVSHSRIENNWTIMNQTV